jgi:hypothetical protein
MPSRFSTIRERRSPSATIAALNSSRSRSERLGDPSAVPPAMIEVNGVRRSWDIDRSSAVFSSSLRRYASASIASARIRSRSAVAAASSASARSASSRRRSASSARSLAAPATVLLTIADIAKAARATQFSSVAIVSRCRGGRWKKLNARALRSDASRPIRRPQTIETSRIAGR